MREDISAKDFIVNASRIITEEGLSALSIRRLGKEMNCNTANIYYYFTDLEELVVYASMDYFTQYIMDVSKCYIETTDVLTAYRRSWECLIHYSFDKPLLFRKLFYGKYRDRLGQILANYYKIFPQKVKKLDLGIMDIITASNYKIYHDNIVLGRCIDAGFFAKEDEEILGTLLLNFYGGFLHDRICYGEENEKIETLKETFFRCLDRTLEVYRIR